MINSIINFFKGLFKQKESKTKYGNAKHFGFWDESYMKDQSFEKSIAPRDQVWTENKIDEDVQYQMGDVEDSPSMEALHNISIPTDDDSDTDSTKESKQARIPTENYNEMK